MLNAISYVLLVSDRCSAGIAEDTSGVNLQKLLQEFPGLVFEFAYLLLH